MSQIIINLICIRKIYWRCDICTVEINCCKCLSMRLLLVMLLSCGRSLHHLLSLQYMLLKKKCCSPKNHTGKMDSCVPNAGAEHINGVMCCLLQNQSTKLCYELWEELNIVLPLIQVEENEMKISIHLWSIEMPVGSSGVILSIWSEFSCCCCCGWLLVPSDEVNDDSFDVLVPPSSF